MKSIVRVIVPLCLLTGVTATAAETQENDTARQLAGKYSVLIQEDCVFSSAGFGPGPLFQALGPTTRGTATIQGVATLQKDGTGEIVARSAFIGTNTTLTPALGSTLTCPLTYTLGSQNEFDATYSCSGVATLGTGSQISLAVSQNGMHVSGYVRGKHLVQAGSTDLAIETVSSAAAPPVPRMCHRTFHLMKAKSEND